MAETTHLERVKQLCGLHDLALVKEKLADADVESQGSLQLLRGGWAGWQSLKDLHCLFPDVGESREIC
jgi:hypothetical protein